MTITAEDATLTIDPVAYGTDDFAALFDVSVTDDESNPVEDFTKELAAGAYTITVSMKASNATYRWESETAPAAASITVTVSE